MSKKLEGKITFVHHEKGYVAIEYEAGGKTRTINGSTRQAEKKDAAKGTQTKKQHHFREGDQVEFVMVKSQRGDKMVADNIQFRYNNSLNDLLNRAKIDNRFTGYLKQVDDKFFVKEKDSYHFFPLKLSNWEKQPGEWDLNEQIVFKLDNIQNPDKTTASLYAPAFSSAYKKAQKLYTEKKTIEAKVYKVTPHGVYVNIIGNEVQAKLPVPKGTTTKEKTGDIIPVAITYLSPAKIVIERVET